MLLESLEVKVFALDEAKPNSICSTLYSSKHLQEQPLSKALPGMVQTTPTKKTISIKIY